VRNSCVEAGIRRGGHVPYNFPHGVELKTRAVCVGNDQYAAGSVAVQLTGQILQDELNSILLIMSEPFRS
jgi:hypothetical protein